VLSWHWVFLVNVPIGLVAAALSVRLLARDRGLGLRAGADALGAVLVTAGLMLTVATIVRTADVGWLSLRTLAWGTVAVLLLAGFVVRQATAARPLIRLGLFRSRTVSGANLTQLVLVAGYFGFQFLGALYLQRVLGYDPLRTGLAFLPVPIVIGAMSLGVAGRLVSRIGGRAVLLPALAVSFVGFLLLARTPVDAVYPVDLLPPLILLGIGAGLALPALAITGMSGIDPDEAGLASGVLNTTQQVGGALGLAVLATLAAGRTSDLLATGSDQAHASAGGYRLVFLAGAALSVVSGVIVALLLRPAKR
jgi:MFS family permease